MDVDTRNSLLERAFQLGFEYEREFGGCAQCAIAAVQDTVSIQNDSIFKAATGIAGGGGLTGYGTCGALIGGSMVLSSFCGRERSNWEDKEKVRRRSYAITKKLVDRFVEEYGSVICREIHVSIFGRPFYIVDAVERRKFEEAGAHKDKCTTVVGKAARWTLEILLDEKILD